MIERVSLDRKIAEELEFEARKTNTPVPTGADLSEPVPVEDAALALSERGVHTSTPVPTGEHRSDADADADGFMRDQLGEKDRKIAKMHEQLERRDEQIMTMLERDRETNILIKGLQGTLERTLRLEAPKDMQAGDSDRLSAGDDV